MLKEWSAYLFKLIRKLVALCEFVGEEFKYYSFLYLNISFFFSAPLPPPSASCFLTDNGSITLTCEIMGLGNDIDEDLIQYSWECPSAIQCHPGSISAEAYVSQESDLSQSVHCIISNPLFRASASITLSTCVPQGE